jgi:hypothetical protein
VLLRYGEEGTAIRTVDPEVIGEITTPGIEIRSSEGHWVRLYFHPTSYQIVRRVYQRQSDRVPVMVEELFTDYRPVGGIYLPFKSALREMNHYAGENHLKTIEYNVDLPDEIFQRTQY